MLLRHAHPSDTIAVCVVTRAPRRSPPPVHGRHAHISTETQTAEDPRVPRRMHRHKAVPHGAHTAVPLSSQPSAGTPPHTDLVIQTPACTHVHTTHTHTHTPFPCGLLLWPECLLQGMLPSFLTGGARTSWPEEAQVLHLEPPRPLGDCLFQGCRL